MSSFSSAGSSMSPTKQALLKIRELKEQLAAAQQSRGEPIAIVSMACRFPRCANTPERFWADLLSGESQTREIPTDRWDLDAYFDSDPDVPGKMYARHGVFLDDLDQMDPDFFGISSREATWVDPQQRLLLEVSWEALERAGWAPERMSRETGLFIGWMHNDYQNESSDSLLNLNPYIATGSAGSFLCGRLSYFLGLQGPSLAVDTACSSSLVALHLACQSLKQGECSRALVGGVNAIISPTTNILTCKLRALSPDGHSLAFDARANGYLRGEGCGMIALRRLSDAQRDGDPILAVIRGSAINHNGMSSGLTAPNPKAQEQVIRTALADARVQGAEVDYLEAHGTGTELGDPIEMRAAATVLGEGRDPAKPLLVGSVKTNIGHLEAAAGMAGLIKVLLSFQHGQIPAHRNFETPNPHIPWDDIPVCVVRERTEWPRGVESIAAVSAFGMSGTNAHVVLEQAPTPTTTTEPREESPYHLLTLSGKTEDALRELAGCYKNWFETHPDVHLADVCYTASAGRRHFERRAALVVENREDAEQLLGILERAGEAPALVLGEHRAEPRVAWQFTGQGSQYVGMASQLYETYEQFRATIDQCDRILRDGRSGSLREVLFSDPQQLNHTHWTQPGIFAVQMGLVRLLESWGCEPDIVLGHSVGQYAAACVAGMMSWEDGLRLISERGRLIGALPAGGGMAAVFATADQLEEVLQTCNALSIAAFNGSHIVVSGPVDELDRALAAWEAQGVRCKRLNTSHAFHSSLMDPALGEFKDIADEIQFRTPQLPLVCNISGQVLAANAVVDGDYWCQHIRRPVRFAQSVDALREFGCDLLVEVGPQPVLTGMAAASWSGAAPKTISILHRDQDDRQSVLAALAQIHVCGAKVNCEALYERSRRNVVVLPTYPFQRRRVWGPPKPQAYASEMHTSHPLLGGRKPLANVRDEERYENWLEADHPQWLRDHQVMDDVVFPGAAYVETALAAGKANALSNVTFDMPLRITERVCLQTIVQTGDDEQGFVEMYSAASPFVHWSKNATARMAEPGGMKAGQVDRQAIAQRCDQTADPEQFYDMLAGFGLQYGNQFRTIQTLRYNEREVLARLRLAEDVRGYHIPPMLLDGAFQSLAIGLLRDADAALFLPAGIERVEVLGAIDDAVWSHAQWDQPDGEVRTANLTLINDAGHVVAQIHQLKLRQLNRAALRKISGSGSQRLLHEVQWRSSHLSDLNAKPSSWLVVGAAAEVQALSAALQSRDQTCLKLSPSSEVEQPELAVETCHIDPDNDEHWQTLLQHWDRHHENRLFDGVVWLTGDQSCPNCTMDELYAGTRLHCSGILRLLHWLGKRQVRRLERGFQIVTHQGVHAMETDRVNAYAAQYWGLGRAIGAEQHELRCRLIDTDGQQGEAEVLAELLLSDSPESQIGLRAGKLYVPRLTRYKSTSSQDDQRFAVRADASYLVTGGLGMLGRAAARWLASRGARDVVLVSRHEPNESTQQVIRDIEEQGCRIHVHQADISCSAEVQQLMARFGADLPELKGVIHAAGLLDDGLVAEQSWERFSKVLAPKVRGAWELHQATRQSELDFFVLYSSAASVLGSPGQSNYATANAFLDGLAHARAAAGLPGLSINWGPWTEGMADDELILKRMALQGITPLTADESHQAMERLLQANVRQATVLDIDWRRMRMGLGTESPPLFEELAANVATMPAGDSALVEELRELQPAVRRRRLNEAIQGELQAILSSPEPPDPDTPVNELGLDSLMAVEFSTRLQQQLGADFAIAPTLLFDYPTVNALTDYLVGLISDLPDLEDDESAGESLHAKETDQDAVAVIGMSCRFPGAESVAEFWQNLLQGVDAVREIPRDRWDVDEYYDPVPTPGKMYTREGGFLENIADFDAEFFGIAGQEACWMDPQHRLLLETSWHALEDAAISPHPLPDTNVGVFMGIMSQDYNQLHITDDVEVIDSFQGAGLSHSAGVGRLSYLFGFEGPSMAIDTASSSSLVAVSQAAKSLLRGDCNLALAGGVNAILTPGNSLLLSKSKMLAPDGRCKSFSADADGFGRGEGCGVVVLKRLSDAERDGDRVLAVIRGSAVCHNGMSGGLTTPNGRAQERVIREALEDARLLPAAVNYLEAHGTGTEYGDPIELRAAAAVLGKGRPRDAALLVGSVKPNIGHLEAAGGISGFIKAVLSIHHGVIPGQIHFREGSPHIPWRQLPLRMVTENVDWPQVEERIAGVSAFGMSGTNAHVVLSGYEQPVDSATDAATNQHLLVLSGRQPEALKSLAGRYADFLEKEPQLPLGAICLTAGAGRRHFDYRRAMVVQSVSELQQRLEAFANDDCEIAVTSLGTPSAAWLLPDVDRVPVGFGRELYQHIPLFRNTVDELSAIAVSESVPPLPETMFSGQAAKLPPTALYALQMALARTWQGWGIEPEAVIGWGVGEYAAASIAGVMSFEEGFQLTLSRERLAAELSQGGTSTEEALNRFEQIADTLDYFPASLPIVASVDGRVVPVHRLLGGSYWRRQVTQAADLTRGLESLRELDLDVSLAFGMLDLDDCEQCTCGAETLVPLVAPGRSEVAAMLHAAGQLYESGFALDFQAIYQGRPSGKIALPNYPFHRQRYWLTDVNQHVAHGAIES